MTDDTSREGRATARRGLPGAGEAAYALAAFHDAFFLEVAGVAFFRRRGGALRLASFWQTAELIEMVADAWQTSAHPELRRRLGALMRGVWLRYGGDWTLVRRYNDDVVWMVLAALRAHEAGGDRRLLAAARTNFDRTWRRAWSQDLGGGLWWTTACAEKNACVNAPAVVAACRLAAALDEPRYIERAERLYEWLRTNLFDEWSGRVNDHVKPSRDGGIEVDKRAYTYNQGAFAGAADLLHRLTGEQAYRTDALRALRFTRSGLAPHGILRSEGTGGDGGGFKGIFARYAVPFARRHRIEELEDWLWLNAAAAWSRRNSCGLIDQDWAAPTMARRRGLYAWDASSAVVLLQLLTAAVPLTPPPLD